MRIRSAVFAWVYKQHHHYKHQYISGKLEFNLYDTYIQWVGTYGAARTYGTVDT